MISGNPKGVGGRKRGGIHIVCVSLEIVRPGESRLQQSLVAYTSEASVFSELRFVDGKHNAINDPSPAHALISLAPAAHCAVSS